MPQGSEESADAAKTNSGFTNRCNLPCKIDVWDAVFYVLFQFLGGVFGVAVAAGIFGSRLSMPAVDYVITVPGRYGTAAAFFAEFLVLKIAMTLTWQDNRHLFPEESRAGTLPQKSASTANWRSSAD